MIESLKVGYKRYRIEVRSNGDLEDRARQGEISHRHGTIRISSGLALPDRAQTIIHEALHAIFHDAGMEWEPSEEERVVERLAPRLTALLADNPTEVRTILEMLKG